MSVPRPPYTGARREPAGPRTVLPLAQVEAIRRAHDGGAKPTELAAAYGVTQRTIYRYLAHGDDPVRRVVQETIERAIAAAPRITLAGETVASLAAEEITRTLRARGWLVPRP